MENILPLREPPKKELFQDIAIEIGTHPAFVEKDWYVVQLLALIAHINKNLGFKMLFSGGTSLSKGYSLIKDRSRTTPPFFKDVTCCFGMIFIGYRLL
jgi:hypothetical protein